MSDFIMRLSNLIIINTRKRRIVTILAVVLLTSPILIIIGSGTESSSVTSEHSVVFTSGMDRSERGIAEVDLAASRTSNPNYHLNAGSLYDTLSSESTNFDMDGSGDMGRYEAKSDPESIDMIQNPSISLSGSFFEDVVISWDPPEDSSAVLSYGIYISTNYNSSGSGYTTLGNVAKGTNSFTHTGGGKGDPETHYYMIKTITKIGSGAHPQQLVKLGSILVNEVNLLSLPLIPLNTNILSVLESINSEYNFVRAYDASDTIDPWKTYRPGRGGDLLELRTGMAFWVTVPSWPVSSAIPGLVPDETVISLEKGWNLASLVSAKPLTVSNALEDIPYTEVNGFDPLRPPVGLKRLGPDDILAPGDCFWVHLSSAAVWTVSFGSSSGPPPDTTPPIISSISDHPDPQISGGVVDFEAVVTDNEGVNDVSIEVFDPLDNSIGNFPMSFDTSSIKWKFGSTYTDLGVYTYIVTAIDTSDNSASASGSFTIEGEPDTTPPIISSILDSPDPQISGGVVDFEAMVADNEGVSEVWIEITNPLGTALGNFSMSFDASSGKWLYSSVFTDFGIHTYVVHAMDTSSNWASSTGTFEIIDGSSGSLRLSQVNFWAYQIQGINEPGVEDALATSTYDMLVLEPTRTDWSSSDREFDTKGLVDRLKGTTGSDGVTPKIVLAYIDIGEAEDWRWFWTWSTGWDCTGPKPVDWPDYIITCDPDGWDGNYPVAYWDSEWKDVIIYGENQDSSPWGDYNSAIDEAIKDGFDGIYLDWVEAYEDPDVEATAIAAGLDPAVEMINFIAEMRTYAKARNPDFLIIQQNAAQLGADHPKLFNYVDAIAQEAIWYDGDATDIWDDSSGYDVLNDPSLTDWYITNLDVYQAAGILVFNCEYALFNSDEAYNNSYALGYVPYVTRRSLSQLTTTHPPDYRPDMTPGIEHEFQYKDQDVLYYIPLAYQSNPQETRIFFGIHGNGRNYQGHFDKWMNLDVADTYNVVLVTPHWDLETFERYQRLNVGFGERADLRLIELFEKFSEWLDLSHSTFFLYGFSAGGQFTHRFVLTHPEYIDRAVAGGSGTYMFPDPDVTWGYGMDLSAHEPIDLTIQLQEAYLVNMSVMVGLNDTERDSGLATNSLADAQGLNRLERARNFMNNHTDEANVNGWPLVWDYQEVPDAGHTSTPIRPLALEYLFDSNDIEILPGFGSFTYHDDGDNADRPVEVYYYRPANYPTPDSKVVFTMHGSARNAVSARDRIVPYADRYNALLIAPEFSKNHYPDADDYNRGFVKDGGGTGNLRARSDWALLTIEELFDIVRAEIPGAPSTYSIQGNSGAGQFISRIPLLVPEARFDVVAGSNSGWYTLPMRDELYPNGIGDLDITDAQIEQVYSKKVVVTVGELDTDPNSYQLKHNEFTDAQGLNRYERALFYYDYMKADAAARGVPFNWDLLVVENVGHPAELMAHATAGAVFAGATTPHDVALSPIDDTYIDEGDPSDVFGASLELLVDGGNQEIAFFKFDLSSITAPVEVAMLKLYITNGADGQQFVHAVADNTWTESTLTWDIAPALGMEIGMTTGGEKDGILYIEITDYINENLGGVVSLAIQTEDTDTLRFSSKEASYFPAQLVLFTGNLPSLPTLKFCTWFTGVPSCNWHAICGR